MRPMIFDKPRLIDENTPKNEPIVAWCDHAADPYVEDEKAGRLTRYAAHVEGASHIEDGWCVIEWGGAFCDTDEYGVIEAEMPDWWFVRGTNFEVAANPTHWLPLPPRSAFA